MAQAFECRERYLFGFRKLLNLPCSEILSLILKSGKTFDSVVIFNDNSCQKITSNIFIGVLND